jgi:uncharacterized protein (TIGR02271 family)
VEVSTVTHQCDELVDEMLARENVEIERTPIGKRIDVMPSIREDGDMIIVPVVEEVLIIERQLILKEEVCIRKAHSTERYQKRVTLRKQEAVVRRLPIKDKAAAAGVTEDASGEIEAIIAEKENL